MIVAGWQDLKALRELNKFYQDLKDRPDSIADSEVIFSIENSFWGTNCWSYVEQSLAIIAPACLYKPHLIKTLIRYPIDAMIAGGLENLEEIIPIGLALAEKERPYLELTEDGKHWLTVVWPTLDVEIKTVFTELWDDLSQST